MAKAKKLASKKDDPYKVFFNSMVSASVKGLEVLTKAQVTRARKIPRKDIKNVYGPWRALVMMANEDSGLILKVFYREIEFKNLLPPRLLTLSGEKLEIAVKDLAREYANQTIGIVRNFMQNSGDVRASIPIITRGFDEIWYPKTNAARDVEDAWQIEFVGGSIMCKLNGVDLSEDFYARFASIDVTDYSGGIEFL
mgnify:CR=1 FL=1